MGISNFQRRHTHMSAICLVTALAVSAVSSAACYVTYQRSCADLHANTKRVCTSSGNPPTAIPCGDVIVSDEDVNDVKSASEGQDGTDAVNTPSGLAAVNITVFSCNGSVCRNMGTKKHQCQGRSASGNACTGSSSSVSN